MSLQVRFWLAAVAVTFAGSAAIAAPIVPDGSWRASCEGGRVDNALVLSAHCRRMDGSMRETKLRITDCAQPARAGNSDGQLICENGPRHVPAAGSWARTCVHEQLSGALLTAICQDGSGGMFDSSLDLTSCNAPTAVGNQNGRLVCESGNRAASMPQRQQQIDGMPTQQRITTQQRPIVVAPENQTVVPLLEGLGIIFGVQP